MAHVANIIKPLSKASAISSKEELWDDIFLAGPEAMNATTITTLALRSDSASIEEHLITTVCRTSVSCILLQIFDVGRARPPKGMLKSPINR